MKFLVKYKVSQLSHDFNIYLGQHRILFHLEENPHVTLTELSEQLNVSKESLSVSVKRLEHNKYIKREQDHLDKRRHLLSLTPTGEDISRQCRSGFDEINYAMFKKLNDEDKKSVLTLFEKMIEGLEG